MTDILPQLSIIIPTVNASDELDLALNSLKKNSTHPLEYLVLVDPDQKTGKLSEAILKVCKKHDLTPIINKKNLGPYGSWNKGAKLASSDYLVFATDDQYFAPDWDTQLIRVHKSKRLVAGRLVEPGIIPVYEANIKLDFGVLPSEFKESEFIAWCKAQKNSGFVQGGFFIPMLISRTDFIKLGDYPTVGTFGTSGAISNDYDYLTRARAMGYEFGTASGSFSYHFQGSSWKKKTLKPKIAAVVLTKNNESTLAQSLASLAWVQEIHLIDANSTDKTATIAKKYGVKFHTRAFDNFARQRNYGLSKVSSFDWVLMLDSDEEVDPDLATELLSTAKDIYLDGVMVKRKNYIWGKWIQHADWYPDERLVFFRPKSVEFVSGVHERANFIRGNGATIRSTYHILHHNYETVAEFITKNLLTYPAAYAHELRDRGVSFSVIAMFETSLAEFMRRYFLTRGYRDGMHGFLLSMLMGLQQLVSYIYLWELTGKSSDFTVTDLKSLITNLRRKLPEFAYWLQTVAIEQSRGARKILAKVVRKTNTLIHRL